MRDNGFKIWTTVIFLVLCGYYLYPSLQNYFLQNRLDSMEPEEREEYVNENYQRVQSIRQNSLSLGLDLQGGMHVVLELRSGRLIRALATNTDSVFNRVLSTAVEQAQQQGTSVVDEFVDEFERQDPDVRLSRYFRSPDNEITRGSSNEDVASFLQQEVSDAIDRALSIIRDRIDRFGVREPSIQKQGTRRVSVELPGVEQEERVRDLLEGTAQLEFRLMANPDQLAQSLKQIVAYYQPDTTAADTAGQAAGTQDADTTLDMGALDQQQQQQQQQQNPLLQVMRPVGRSVIFGAASAQDTAQVGEMLRRPPVQEMLPQNINLMWTANPVSTTEQGREVFYLLGVRGRAELTGDVITDARVDFTRQTNQPQVTMVMNSEGARTWSRLTGANVGKNIAIVMDNVVYSYPQVESKIPSGRSSITGLESSQEAEDIVTVLKSGALPAPVDIIEQRTVGPSLGASSIRAGTISLVAGLLLVALFMVVYYRLGGVVANIALLLNIIFIFGVLAGFNATLTLPGIAGIVLTIGMAVDANVLIFERIREEQAAGKTLGASIDVGYSKALTAIADANITTFFVGVILFSFGVGPIQGFAVTLMAGIVSSMYTAIVVTRILFDWMVKERKMVVSYG